MINAAQQASAKAAFDANRIRTGLRKGVSTYEYISCAIATVATSRLAFSVRLNGMSR